jgi:hypothetical protein
VPKKGKKRIMASQISFGTTARSLLDIRSLIAHITKAKNRIAQEIRKISWFPKPKIAVKSLFILKCSRCFIKDIKTGFYLPNQLLPLLRKQPIQQTRSSFDICVNGMFQGRKLCVAGITTGTFDGRYKVSRT